MRRARIVGLVVVSTLVAARAHTDPAARLVYSAPPACPDAAAFEAAVHERAPRAVIATGAARTFTIAIEATADGFTGSVAGDQGAPRALSAERCDDLVSGLALVTALAIDPNAAFDVPPPPPPPPPPPRVAPALPPWQLAVLAAAELDVGVTPDVMPAGTIEARVHRRGLGHLDLGAVVGRDTASTKAGLARFTWAVARGSACWTPFDGVVAVDACAHVEAGLLRATGVDVVRAQSLTRSWLAVGAHVAARWPASGRLFAEMRAGGSAPLLRDRFYFTPNVLIHEAASVTPWFTVGVGLRFW